MPTAVLKGINVHIKTLETIAEKCGEKKKDDKPAVKDDFQQTKATMYRMLEVLRENIRERQALQKNRGSAGSYEVIEKGVRIREQMQSLERYLPKLQEIHRKQQNKTRTFSKEELQKRYQDIRVLKRCIDEVKCSFQGNTDLPDLPEGEIDASGGGNSCPRATLFGNSALRAAGNASDSKRDLTDEEAGAMDRFKNRDAMFDNMLDEISLTVDRLKPIAEQIGTSAQRQQLLAEDIRENAEKAEDDLRSMNVRLHEVMQYEKGTTFFCRFFLIMILMACLGFLYNQIT